MILNRERRLLADTCYTPTPKPKGRLLISKLPFPKRDLQRCNMLGSACSFELSFFVTCQFAQAVLKGGHEMDSVSHQEGLQSHQIRKQYSAFVVIYCATSVP